MIDGGALSFAIMGGLFWGGVVYAIARWAGGRNPKAETSARTYGIVVAVLLGLGAYAMRVAQP